MKIKFFHIILIICSIYSCTNEQEQNNPTKSAIKKFKIESSKFPDRDKTNPEVVQAGNPEIIKVNQIISTPANTNVHKAGKPIIRSADTSKFSKLKTIHSLISKSKMTVPKPLLAGTPEVVTAKDAYIKDQNPHNFSSFSKLQGLNDNLIRTLTQDSLGNLWIGTAGRGFSKFDGKYFTQYTVNEGFNNNPITSTLLDKSGNIWFSTLGGGLTKFDGKYLTQFTVNEGLISNLIYCLMLDSNGNIWIGTDKGTSKYDGKIFTHFYYSEEQEKNITYSIFQDKNGSIWLGSMKGVYKLDGQKLQYFSEKEGFSDRKILSINQDYKNNLWFGTEGGGAIQFNGKSFTHYTIKEGLCNNYVLSILIDTNGDIWFGTNGGACLFKENAFFYFTEYQGVSNNNISCILQDKAENIWLGTNGGISRYDGKSFMHYSKEDGLIDNNVYFILNDKNQNLWFGTDGSGLIKYDRNNFIHFPGIEGISNSRVRCILEDNSGNLWFGTYGNGLIKFDGKYFSVYKKEDGLGSNIILDILQDKNGNIWMTTGDAGVVMFDGKSFTYYTEKQGLQNNRAFSVLTDKKGDIWIGTAAGFSKFDGKNFTNYKIKAGEFDSRVRCMLLDKENNLWIGLNEGGVVRFKNDSIIFISEKEGLSNKSVLSILQDKTGNIWFGTRIGLNKLSVKNIEFINSQSSDNNHTDIDHPLKQARGLFKTYLYEDGFLGVGCNRGAICEDNDGTIWIGANGILSNYHHEGEVTESIPPEVELINIELFNEGISWIDLEKNRDTVLMLKNGIEVRNFNFNNTTKWFGIPTNLSLAYNNNSITFRFIGISLQESKKVKYQYKLDGIDDTWNTPTLRNEVTYGSLPYGDYTFRVKAMISENRWSNEFSYSFAIRPPWWKSKWFTLFSFFFLLSLFIGFNRWRNYSLLKQKNILEQIVKAKTKEVVLQKEEIAESYDKIKAANEELRTIINQLNETQKKLIQSEKMASVGILASGLAHEINNPLNYISGGIYFLEKYFKKNPPADFETISPSLTWMRTGINRANEIVRSVSQLYNSRDFPFTNCDLHQIIDASLELLHDDLNNAIEVIKNYSDNPLVIFGNEKSLRQAFMNILSNSCHAISNGGIIKIVTSISNNKININVTDNGNGINQEDLDKIFDPFFTTKDPGKGTGLGLTLTYHIIQDHNGKIEIESKSGLGTEVKVEFHL